MKWIIVSIITCLFLASADAARGVIPSGPEDEKHLNAFEKRPLFDVPFRRAIITTDLIDGEVSTGRSREVRVQVNSRLTALEISANEQTVFQEDPADRKLICVPVELNIGENLLVIKAESGLGKGLVIKRKIFFNPLVLVEPLPHVLTYSGTVKFEAWTGEESLREIRIIKQRGTEAIKEYKVVRTDQLFQAQLELETEGNYVFKVCAGDFESQSFTVEKKTIPFSVKLSFIGFDPLATSNSIVRITDLNRPGRKTEIQWRQGEVKPLTRKSGDQGQNMFVLEQIMVKNDLKYCTLKSVDMDPVLNIRMFMSQRPTEYFGSENTVVPVILTADRRYVPTGEKAEFRIDSNGSPLHRCSIRINDTVVTTTTPEGIFRYQFMKPGKFTVIAEHYGNLSKPVEIEVGKIRVGEPKKFNLSFRELYKTLYPVKGRKAPSSNEEMTDILNQIWPSISFDKHHSIGWVITGVLSEQGRLALKLVNLEKGDVIRAIDGYTLDSAEERRKFWQFMQTGFLQEKTKKVMILDIERSGDPVRLIYKLR